MNHRRTLLKAVSAFAVIPLVSFTGNAIAAKNDSMRTALKYVDKPQDGKKCSDCMHFIPGADAKALGGCKMFPGDTEISPNGFCNVWVKKS